MEDRGPIGGIPYGLTLVTTVARGAVRELHQPIRYHEGRAQSYRCPDCDQLHPLTPRDWDEARQVYAGRACAGKADKRRPDPLRASERRRYEDLLGFRATVAATGAGRGGR